MITQQWALFDRAHWPAGPWDQEPFDKRQWVDATTGLWCLLHRNTLGAFCGYVGVPKAHPQWGCHYDTVAVDVHGGLTYSDLEHRHRDAALPAHWGLHFVRTPDDDPSLLWLLGFDTGHGDDVSPYDMLSAGLPPPERPASDDPAVQLTHRLNYLRDCLERGRPVASFHLLAGNATYKTAVYVSQHCRRLAAALGTGRRRC